MVEDVRGILLGITLMVHEVQRIARRHTNGRIGAEMIARSHTNGRRGPRKFLGVIIMVESCDGDC